MSRAGLVTLVVANLFVAFRTLRHEWGYYETAFAVIMVLLKLAADAASHRLEHGRLATDLPHADARKLSR